jgi:iron complex outermembrane receptor protein
VTAEEIQRLGFRNFSDVLNSLAGFQTSYDRMFTYVGTRGFRVPGDYNARILTLIDGHRLNENIYGGMLIDDGLIVNIDLIERIEVVRGSASSLYGNNAFFGVINVITKSGRDIQGLEFSAGTASNGRDTATLTYGDKLNSGMEVLFSASLLDSDGQQSLYYPEYDLPILNHGIAQNNDSAQLKNGFVKLNYENITFNAGYVEHIKVDPTAAYGAVFNDPRSLTNNTRKYADLKYQKLLSSGLDISMRIYYDEYHQHIDQLHDYSVNRDLSQLSLFQSDTSGNWWGLDFIGSQNILDNHYLSWGVEYNNTYRQKHASFDAYRDVLRLNAQYKSVAVYLQDEYDWSDTLKFNIGLRYDKYSKIEKAINYRIAAIWSLSAQSTLKLIRGTAFRAPNAYEQNIHDYFAPDKIVKPLTPEEIVSNEVIFESQINENLRWVLSFYDNDITDLLTLVIDPTDGVPAFVNGHQAAAKGGEIELQGQWQSNWSGALSYSHQRPTTDSDERITHIPKHQLKLTAITPELFAGLTAGLTMQYESGRETLQGGKTRDNILTHLTVSNAVLLPNLTLSASIYNLFDQDYSFPGEEQHFQNEIAQDGRSYRLKVTYVF